MIKLGGYRVETYCHAHLALITCMATAQWLYLTMSGILVVSPSYVRECLANPGFPRKSGSDGQAA